MSYFLGIDGGASKTRCLLGDEYFVVASGVSGPCNPVRVGLEQCGDALLTAITRACDAAGMQASHIQSSCLGLAGAARAEISNPLRDVLRQIISGHIEIVGDNQIALHAALGSDPGVVVISGTGSIAYGRGSDGRITRAGGWGHAISDEGSGTWIGRTAITAIFRAADENQHEPRLLQEILRFWNLPTREALVIKANAPTAPDFASLVPTITVVANEGDPLARSILSRAGSELAALARIAITKIFEPATSVLVAMSGGVFRHCAQVRDSFVHELAVRWPEATIKSDIADPAFGALDLARRAAANSDEA